MSGRPLSERLANFRQNFKQILGNKRQGYDELSQLEQPLVGGSSDAPQHHTSYETGGDDAYLAQHGVPRPGSRPRPPHQPMGAIPQSQAIPSQVGQHMAPGI
jgi:hypothetical protein